MEFQAESFVEGGRPSYWHRNASPMGTPEFGWGYGGAGPSALAWSLLEDALSDVDQAELTGLAASDFLKEVVARYEQEHGWELPQQEILAWFEGWKRSYAEEAGDLGVRALLPRYVAWALRQSHPADRELQPLVNRDLRESAAVRELAGPWQLSKLEVAAWVAAWVRAHLQEVDEARAAWAARQGED